MPSDTKFDFDLNLSNAETRNTNHQMDIKVDLSQYNNEFGSINKIKRAVWNIVWLLLFRPSPRIALGFAWRRFLLRLFGAQIGLGVNVHASCRIWAPWNLYMDDHSCLSHHVDCYCVDKIIIGANVTVSQYSFLCTAGHDIKSNNMRLTTSPIRIECGAWICADVFLSPGVVVGQGAVAAARSVVVNNIDSWTVVGGNPAKYLKNRSLDN